MNKIISFFMLMISCVGLAHSQDTSTYYEKLENGLIRFYLDKFYYLTDKNCTYKSIERISKFDFTLQTFNGPFRDFDDRGNRILTGSYSDGKKNGFFQAFHPNGQIKWEVHFENNLPKGEWKYYYPDGKPLLTIDYEQYGYFIKSYWDKKGNQKVVNGDGDYEFAIPFEGYTSFGYDFYLVKGKVKAGRPEGTWNIFFYNINQAPVYGFSQRYINGELFKTFGEDEDTDEEYDIFRILPYDYFPRAEFLNNKSCNFDDYSNYYRFLANHFNKALASLPDGPEQQGHFDYTVSIDKMGLPMVRSLKYNSNIQDKDINNMLREEARMIDFYFPTLKDDKAISDIIRVSGMVAYDNTGRLSIHSIKIEREIKNSSN